MLAPKTYGGLELHSIETMRVWEAVARIDSAAAWNLVMHQAIAAYAAWLPAEGAHELFRNGPPTVAGALNPPAAATRVEGGWRITGQCPFGSGCHNAQWLAMPAVEMHGNQPKVDPKTGQPSPFGVFFPRSEARILDTWHTYGMRGTGSTDYAVENLFVPDRLIAPVAPLSNPAPGFEEPLFRMWPWTATLGEVTISDLGDKTMATVDPLHIVRDLEPLILRHAATAEVNRKMAPEVMEALVDTGLLRMWIPQALGGLEMAPNMALAVMEALARIDAATGWVVSNCVFITILYQFLPAPVIEELLGDPRAVTCGSFVPPGTAHATGDGYLVNGNWTFGSASHYATSLVTLTVLTDANGPVLGPGGAPVSVLAFFAPQHATFLDTWYTLGLRATGSTNFTVANLHVPRDHTFVLGPWETTAGPFAAPLYRMGLIIDAVRIAQVGVGIAQGALEEFRDLAAAKTPAYTTTLTADRATVQERVARAQALIQAGRHTLRATVAEAWEAVQNGPRITGQTCVPMGLAASFALDAAVQAVDLLYAAGGTTAFRDESPLQQRFRDLQTLRQNAVASWSRYESLGKLVLRRQSDWPFHQL